MAAHLAAQRKFGRAWLRAIGQNRLSLHFDLEWKFLTVRHGAQELLAARRIGNSGLDRIAIDTACVYLHSRFDGRPGVFALELTKLPLPAKQPQRVAHF